MRSYFIFFAIWMGCLADVSAQKTFDYPPNDSVKVCLEKFCDSTVLEASKLLKYKSLELVTDTKGLKVKAFNLVLLDKLNQVVFMQTVKDDELDNYHISFFKKAVAKMTINTIVACDKKGNCYSLKELNFRINP
ncbi:MAG: hypothetical protein K0Q66_1697 [Chitinophagaceae bacterium]|jgi:hypothetical protein|nr:hypothetical protein [Chitinophagaceae bacterium]